MRRTCVPTRMPTRSTGKEPRAIDRQSLGLGVTHTAQEGGALGCGGPRADSESDRRGRVPGVRCTTQATRAEQESNALSASRSTG